MTFETPDITLFELETQIAVENASLEKKAFKEVLKQLNPATKEYKKALEKLNKTQAKEWHDLSKKVELKTEEILLEGNAHLTETQKKMNQFSRIIKQQKAKIAEKQLTQPIRPKQPGQT